MARVAPGSRQYTGGMPDTPDPDRAEADVDVFEAADRLLEVPRAHARLLLIQDGDGLLIAHGDEPLLRCHLTRNGMGAAGFIARALGVDLPALGEETIARVSTGVLFRAISIARLDLGNDASFPLLERFLEEAAIQRGATPSEA